MFVHYAYPQGPAPLVPDLTIDFEDGYGIPVANGGMGGPGSELVQVISPQDSGGGARRVRAPRYWDPAAKWTPGEPIFVPKQAGRLVGWSGPRDGGYWTGPMMSRTSVSETVAVYNNATGLTVTTVAGGVVGPEAIRCDIAGGQSGDAWAASPAATMTSGWIANANGVITVCYLHAVVELLGAIENHRFRFGLYDQGASQFVEQITQRYDEPDQQRAGKVYRGIGPHGGHLYEIWALARLISSPVGPLSAFAYLLSSGSGGNPVRTVIVHGCQTYFHEFRRYPMIGVPPFFSYARGTAVVWTTEELRVTDITEAYTFAGKWATPALVLPSSLNIAGIVARNNSGNERWVHIEHDKLEASFPNPGRIVGFNGRAVLMTEANYARRATVNGLNVVDHGTFQNPASNPSYLGLGAGEGQWFGQLRRCMLWRRALTDTELLRAWRGL